MDNNTFIYSFKVNGLERKKLAAIIAEELDAEVKYAGYSAQ